MAEPDFRALCAQLLEEVLWLSELPYEQEPDAELMAATRAALAQPAPEPTFTDEEVAMHSAPWSYLNPAPDVPTGAKLTALVRVFQAARNAKRAELRALPNPYREDTASDLADHAGISAVLTRWGQDNG